MFREYVTQRLRWPEWMILAFLWCLFVLGSSDTFSKWSSTFVFFFTSIVVLRLIDDAGSVIIDRSKHRDHLYLKTQYFPSFLRSVVGCCILYSVLLFLWDESVFKIVGLYLIIAIVTYLIFYKNEGVLQFLALTKYSVLFYALGVQDWAVVIAGTIIMASYELLEKSKHFYIGLLMLLFTGLILLYDSMIPWTIALVLIPCVLSLIFRKNKFIKYLPILYFPITYFILKNGV